LLLVSICSARFCKTIKIVLQPQTNKQTKSKTTANQQQNNNKNNKTTTTV